MLDTNGMPTSWNEVLEHLRVISKTGKFNVVAMETTVVTPEMVGSHLREKEEEDLVKRYRRLIKNQPKTIFD